MKRIGIAQTERGVVARNRRIASAAVAALGAMLATSHVSEAASGTWSPGGFSGPNGSGSWSNPANWSGGIIADGAGFTADFSTLNITGATVVSLDSSRTIGALRFADAATQSHQWTLDNNGNPANVLTLNNGVNQPVITIGNSSGSGQTNQNTTISATIAGTNGFIKTGPGALTLAGDNTYSGVTVLNSTVNGVGPDLYLAHNNALGTSTLFIDPGSSNQARVLLNSGIVINNDITINTSRATAGANGAIMTNGNVGGAVLNGDITINNRATSGGHFAGPVDNSLTNFLTINGAITLSNTYTSVASNMTNTPGNGLLLRAGNFIFSGGGSYFRVEMRTGGLRLGATNGLATNAYLDIGGNVGNPQPFAIFDLAGFNQTLVGIQNAIGNGGTATITNTSTTSASTLTLTPADPVSNPNQANLVFTAGGAGTGALATFTDTDPNAPLNLVINGAANGMQTLNTPNSSYRGFTRLTSGILSINTLANGGANSSIGASTSDAANLVFDGGTLRYTGGTTSTDRNFTINATKNANINITNAASTVTVSGGGTGAGGLVKSGPGILALSGTNTYTGNTTISAGRLNVNGSLAGASNVSIASGATLGGTGTIGGAVTPDAGGIISPGDAATPVGTLTVGALTLNSGAQINFEFDSNNDRVQVANSGGLTLNGGNLFLFNTGTSAAFATNGTYSLFNITGGFSGSLNTLFVSNPVAGKLYTLASTGSTIDLTIGDATTVGWTNSNGDNLWTQGGNWDGTIPNAIGQNASFGAAAGSGSVDLNGSKTVSGVIFNNSGTSYTLHGSGVLTLDNGSAAGAITVTSGSHSINVPVTLGGNLAIMTASDTDALALNGNVSGSFPMTVAGPGAVTLTGTNSFTSFSANGGTVNVGNGGATGSLGAGPVTLANNTALNFNTTSNYNFGQSITGSGTVSQLGSGTTTVGDINVTAVNVSNGGLVAGAIAQTNGIAVTGSGRLIANGAVSGAGALAVNTTGSVVLGATNSYTGGTTIDAGTVILNAAGALPTNTALAVNGGVLDMNGNDIQINNILDAVSSNGVITNNGPNGSTSTVTFIGSESNYNMYAALNDGANGGKVALSTQINNVNINAFAIALHATSTYSGGTTVNRQSLDAMATNALGTGSVLLKANNASTNSTHLGVAGGITLPNAIIIEQGNPGANNGAIQYLAATAGSSTITGPITVQQDNLTGSTIVGPAPATSDFLNFTGPINATGSATTISTTGNIGLAGGGSYQQLTASGRVNVNAPNGIATNAVLGLSGGTVELNGNSQTLAGLTGGGQVGNSGSAATLTVNAGSNGTFSGSINGNVNFVKGGAGVQTLGGVSNYTGATVINGGTIKLASPNTTPIGAYSFDDIVDTGNNPVNSGQLGQGFTVRNNGSGTGMDGTVNHADDLIDPFNGTATVTTGRFGNGLNLQGTGSSVDIASQIVDQAGNGSWTLSAWVKTTTTGSSIASKNVGGTTWNPGYSVFYLGSNPPSGTPGNLPTAVRNSGGFMQGDPSPTNVADNEWHMVTFVSNAGAKLIYVDGVLTTMTLTDFNNADVSTFVRLGYNTDTLANLDGNAHFAGDLDEIKFFATALTGAQIQGLYNTNTVPGGGSQYLPVNTAVTLAAAGTALDLSDNNQTIGSLAGVAGSNVILGLGNLSAGGDNNSTTFAGVISGQGGIIKNGSGELTLTGANTYTGGTTVNAGTLSATRLRNGALTVNAGTAKITQKATPNDSSGTSVVSALSISNGATLDLTNNSMVIDYTGSIGTQLSDVRAHLAAGRLTTSSAGTPEFTRLGYADNAELGLSSFGGVNVDNDSVLIKFTYQGDADLDGDVDGIDVGLWAQNFTGELGGAGTSVWSEGDWDYDGDVDGIDVGLWAQAFTGELGGGGLSDAVVAWPTNHQAAQLLQSLGVTLVPEPAAIGALAMASLAMLARRRRV